MVAVSFVFLKLCLLKEKKKSSLWNNAAPKSGVARLLAHVGEEEMWYCVCVCLFVQADAATIEQTDFLVVQWCLNKCVQLIDCVQLKRHLCVCLCVRAPWQGLNLSDVSVFILLSRETKRQQKVSQDRGGWGRGSEPIGKLSPPPASAAG